MHLITNNITLATSKLKHALELFPGEKIRIDDSKKQQTVDLCQLSDDFRQALLNVQLTKLQRAQIVASLGDRTSIQDEIVCSVTQLGRLLKTLVAPGETPIEVKIGNRWYPVPVTQSEIYICQFTGNSTFFEIKTSICEIIYREFYSWSDNDFIDDEKRQRHRSVRELFLEKNIRMSTQASIESFKERANRAAKITKYGLTMSSIGPVLAHNKFLWTTVLDTIPLGTPDKPRVLVTEDELEIDADNHRSYYRGDNERHVLPFIRAFSLDLKKYVYVDVDDMKKHVFDENATDRLFLPDEMKTLINKIFSTSTSDIFGDLFKGRHGGIVVLANGPQGVGKTLTAECFAEHTKRPLYVLEMGELGTNLASVEESLQRVFTRAARWNAVLLFDEADVFMAKRSENDLERSAIVGVFLRLLDRYEGMFFLTTNRATVIDRAFRSRITLTLPYPELDRSARKKVWDAMLKAADITVSGDMGPVYDFEIDGRQIRNQVRLLKMISTTNAVSVSDVLGALRYVSVAKE
jgi:hypothetical protein